jgi:hypothetical protein
MYPIVVLDYGEEHMVNKDVLHCGICGLPWSPSVVSKIAPTQVLGTLVANAKSAGSIGHVRPPKLSVT